MTPKVSVVVPVHDTAATLSRCLDSLLDQTLREIEVVCVDDGSGDYSISILEEFAGRDSRLEIVRFGDNRGAGAARNAGIGEARAGYVGFVDADDFVKPDFYERLFNAAVAENADVAKGTVLRCDADSSLIRRDQTWDINDKIRRFPAYFSAGFTSALYRKKLLEEKGLAFPEGLVHFEDPPFAIKVALNCNKIVFDDEAVYYYVDNLRSTSRNPTVRHIYDHIAGTRIVLDFLERNSFRDADVWIVRDFLKNQLMAWQSRADATPEMKAIAVCGLEDLGLLRQESEEASAFVERERVCDILCRLRKNARKGA